MRFNNRDDTEVALAERCELRGCCGLLGRPPSRSHEPMLQSELRDRKPEHMLEHQRAEVGPFFFVFLPVTSQKSHASPKGFPGDDCEYRTWS